jgi:signal transduction histidine kinase
MSHELRTPLNVIIGFSQLLIDEVPGKVNGEQKQCLEDVLGEGNHLLDLINEVLDLSRIESGKIELRQGKVALEKLVESLKNTMAPILSPRKQVLSIEVQKGMPPVYIDQVKLEQVLLNLLGNASKYTPDGGLLKIKADQKNGWCQVSVMDNGIGIKKEDFERVFEPFIQLDNPLARGKSGTGLGLTLVKQIVERYGGRVWVDSEPGKGSCFSFTVPLFY